MEVCNIVQEVVTKAVLKRKECKKAKWLSEEALQIAQKKREAKGKGERERYIQLNAEFQRIARRDKKAFLSEQCKEIQEDNRMERLISLQENWRYQGNSSGKDGHNKGQKQQGPNRSRRDYKEVGRIHRKTNKKHLNDPDNHDGVVIPTARHLGV